MFETLKQSEIRYVNEMCAKYDILNLSIGEPHLKIPLIVKIRAILALLLNKTNYSENVGLISLRNQIKKRYLDFNNAEVIVTAGASIGLNICLDYLINDNDEIIIIKPSYVAYEPMITMKKGKAIYSSIDELESNITPKTKGILLSNPNNPTGHVLTKEEIEILVYCINEYCLYCICEEIYSDLTYDTFTSLSTIPSILNRLFIVSSFSKNYSMTGFRLGYIICQKKHYNIMKLIHAYEATCANVIAQYSIIPLAAKINRKRALFYKKRMKYVTKRLDKMNISYIKPEAGFYLFIKYRNYFAKDLLERRLLGIVPGETFGSEYIDYGRINISVSYFKLKKALKILSKYVGD